MDMKTILLSASSLLLLASCGMGPWNTQVNGASVQLPRVTISNLLVASRAYDTIWITRSVSFSATYDSTAMFVDTARSQVRVIRLDGPGAPDTMPYRMGNGLSVAWLPIRSVDTVLHGATYRLEAHLVWDSSAAFCAGGKSPEWKVSDFHAQTYTPATYRLESVQAPAEALLPAVAAMGSAGLEAYPATSDTARARGLGQNALDSIRKGLPVYRALRDLDTVWYIRSAEACVSFNGTSNIRQDRAYLATQSLDLRTFGGLLELQRFDSTKARILDLITQALDNSLGRKFDSARYYQRGQWRYVDFLSAYQPNLPAWPGKLQIKNLDIGYTGVNVLYEYAMDTLYDSYLQGLGGGLKLPYTNIQGGGTGYFAGSAVDSIRLFVLNPTADTFQVQALRKTWCRSRITRMTDTLNGRKADSLWKAVRPPQCLDIDLPTP
jgi:hypothetical protein